MSIDHRYLAEVIDTVRRKGANLGRVASVLGSVSGASGHALSAGWLTARGFDCQHDGGVKRVLEALEATGIFKPRLNGLGWDLPAPQRLAELSIALQGASAAWDLAQDVITPEIAVTLPGKPSDIARALDFTLMDYSRLMTTDDAFDAVAAQAIGEFTVLTPFLNEAAAPLLAGVFERTRARRRTLVVRNFTKVRGALASVRSQLESANVSVLDYLNQDRITLGAYETFHAKVALADNDFAYVGSANFLRYARSSVELGVMLNGRSVRVVSGLVRAIREIARPCDLAAIPAA